MYNLPPQSEIAPVIERYRRALLEPARAFNSASQDGATLYRMLVAPAAALIPPVERLWSSMTAPSAC